MNQAVDDVDLESPGPAKHTLRVIREIVNQALADLPNEFQKLLLAGDVANRILARPQVKRLLSTAPCPVDGTTNQGLGVDQELRPIAEGDGNDGDWPDDSGPPASAESTPSEGAAAERRRRPRRARVQRNAPVDDRRECAALPQGPWQGGPAELHGPHAKRPCVQADQGGVRHATVF